MAKLSTTSVFGDLLVDGMIHGNVTGNLTGNASTATSATTASKADILTTARNIALGGMLTGSASFNGSANITINASVAKPPKSGDWFSGGIPTVNTDGVMEVGKYIDFHNTDASTNDYDVRLHANTSTPCVITLPTAAGTLARTNDNVASATKLQTPRTINGTNFDGSANITTANWGTARTLTIGNKGQSVNGSGNVSWSLADIGAVETVAWDASIKCATWSRLFQYSAASAVIGGAFLVNIQATRGNVVYGPTVLVNFGHSSTCNIVQINNISYSNIKIRGVVDGDGAGYLEIYDNVNSATNSTTQSVTVSVTKLTKGLSITKYTSFTNGSTIPKNYASKGEITTVSGCYYTGKAATSGTADTATKLKTARNIKIGNATKSFNGTANVEFTLAEIGIGSISYDSLMTTINSNLGNL